MTWLAYYSSNRTIDLSNNNFYTTTIDSATAGYILSGYTRLIERDPSGNQVSAFSLKGGLNLGVNAGLSWNRGSLSTNGDIKYMTIVGTDRTKANFNILITFVVSNKVGILEYGNTPVQPRSIETIIEINNWPYASTSNTLSLEMVAGSGSASASGREFVSVLGGAKVYLRAAAGVSVDGKDGSVSASAWADASFDTDLEGLAGLKNQLQGRYAGSTTLKKTEIKFPAGAAKIIYDPTLGQGEPMNAAATSSASIISVAAFAIASILAVLLM